MVVWGTSPRGSGTRLDEHVCWCCFCCCWWCFCFCW